MKTDRWKQVRQEKGVDAILAASPANIRYLSGFTGRESYLYLSEGRQVILTDSRYTLQAQKESGGMEVRAIGGGKGYGELVAELLREDAVHALGFEDGAMLYGTVQKLQKEAGLKEGQWIPLGEELSLLRARKSPEEIECLAKAEAIGDAAFSHMLEWLRPGVTELAIAAELDYFMRTHGAEDTSFDTIAASGLHSAMPHAVPTEKELEMGDFLTMDFGCKYRGYCSDMTRTVVMGKASQRQREIYGIVLEAQQMALRRIRAGMTGREMDAIARDIITRAGYGDYFGHGLGHSVGLEIHERPALSSKDETVLEPGMIETVEPGIYVPDFGGVRIEDMVVVTEDGCRNLTFSPKELLELS